MNNRKCEMVSMRNDGFTLRAIGEKFGVCRERVRQIIGNTKRVKNWKHEVIKNSPDRTVESLSKELGYAKATVRAYQIIYHPMERYKVRGNGTSRIGQRFEEIVSAKMESVGISNELMPYAYPFDILAFDFVRIDVKGAAKRKKSPSLSNTSPTFSFHVRENRRSKSDFYIFVIGETGDMFIVPSKEVPEHRDQIIFCFPTNRPELSKWQKYHNRWDLIFDFKNGS